VTFLIYFSQNTLTSTPGTASTTSFGSTTNKKSAAKPTKEISGRIRYLPRPVKQLRLQWRWFLGNLKQNKYPEIQIGKKEASRLWRCIKKIKAKTVTEI
jgi:hypothetical protein